ncbi:DnaJ C-terminal domain-containing protein [Oxalicibacterium faecigallinarum]|uniref:Curved DNA-binding protein n=1 Tax=Oxalicibacterium faecigallinarum TaxID=573741 RepID=A0A8J3AN08_9BURK|nr:DnaJ C-terminal domain-containing protein [Oxalicibacterium faecigallinarum]GGI16763.1 curved DNA-binding protein [Oxalicibacterium faecigallinarum]
MKFKDHYATLGVPQNATPEAIKKAYRKLARQYHPDVSREPLAELRFKEVGEAYAILRDADKRVAYDQIHASYAAREEVPTPRPSRSYHDKPNKTAASASARQNEENFGNILDEIMGRPGTQGAKPRNLNVHGSDQHAKVQIELEDTFHGAARSISIPTYVTDEYGMPLVSKRTLKVSIPRGIRGGQSLRLVGQGHAGIGDGKTGDLYLEVVIRPHRRYRVEGRDLFVDVPLTAQAASLGTSVEVATPDGTIQLSVPPGSAAGRKLRIRGKGIPGEPPGDLYAVITQAATPMHTAVAKKAYRALKAAFDFSPRTTNSDR